MNVLNKIENNNQIGTRHKYYYLIQSCQAFSGEGAQNTMHISGKISE